MNGIKLDVQNIDGRKFAIKIVLNIIIFTVIVNHGLSNNNNSCNKCVARVIHIPWKRWNSFCVGIFIDKMQEKFTIRMDKTQTKVPIPFLPILRSSDNVHGMVMIGVVLILDTQFAWILIKCALSVQINTPREEKQREIFRFFDGSFFPLKNFPFLSDVQLLCDNN